MYYNMMPQSLQAERVNKNEVIPRAQHAACSCFSRMYCTAGLVLGGLCASTTSMGLRLPRI